MNLQKKFSRGAAVACLLATTTAACASGATVKPPGDVSLAGTWALMAADVLHPDGSRSHDYSDAPKGLLFIDGTGRYSLQIFRGDRARFTNPDKTRASAQEYRAAVLGASTHFGTISVEPGRHQLVFHIEAASFPNWEGQEQHRAFELHGDTLSYQVPPRPDGSVPVSVWRRIGR